MAKYDITKEATEDLYNHVAADLDHKRQAHRQPHRLDGGV